MTALRRHILQHRALAAWVLAFAFLVKVLVPAGYMTIAAGNGIALEICSGMEPGPMPDAMPGMAMHHDQPQHSGKADMPCAFAGMNAPATAAVDPVLLIVAIAFIFTMVRRETAAATPRSPPYLRPPLRGPPVTA